MSSPAKEKDTSLGERFPRTAEEMDQLRAKGVAAAKRMLGFIDASPTPYHATENVAQQLREDGFELLSERDAWTLSPGDRRYVVRSSGTLIAFMVGKRSPAEAGFRIIGAHTDSPNLRVKPQPSINRKGYLQLGVEVYGGALLSTWLDRDLSLAGRVVHRTDDGELLTQLVDFRRPIARVATLAVHLDRTVNTEGLVLDKQKHMVPLLGLGDDKLDLKRELAGQLDVDPAAITSYDLCFYDTQKGALGGLKEELVFCSRIDDLANCHAAVEALCGTPDPLDATTVIALYDHEECGSRSAAGAASSVLRDVLDRVALAYPEGQVQAFPRAMAASILVSADLAHAVHPNYPDRHDDNHGPAINRGLVIKTNANQAYATSGPTAAFFEQLCHEVGYEPQHFVNRSDLPCGSTIGPITAAQLGIQTVDVGAAQLSMHSCREVCGTLDVYLAQQTFQQLFR